MSSFVTKKSVLNVVLIVLLIAALLLGYLVYQKYVPPTVSTGTNNSPNSPQQTNQPLSAEASEYADMSDAELVRVMPTTGEADEATLQAYSVQMSERAVVTDRIVITENCQTEPAVASVTLGSTVTFVNQSSKSQGLLLTPERTVTIGGGQSNAATIDFETGQGVYGYSCDGQQALAGILLVQ